MKITSKQSKNAQWELYTLYVTKRRPRGQLEVGQEAGKDGQEAVGHSTERKVQIFTVPGKEVGQEASKNGQEAVGHSTEYCHSLYLAKRSARRPARMARRLLDTVL